MRLTKYRVQDFRSVADSNWLDTADVTALIGTNESGKTNLLLPLWKLNPASEDGAVDLIADAPRSRYNQIRSASTRPDFITAQFMLSDAEASEVARLSGRPVEGVRIVQAVRSLESEGKLFISFPEDRPIRTVDAAALKSTLDSARAEIETMAAMTEEDALKKEVVAALVSSTKELDDAKSMTAPQIEAVATRLQSLIPSVVAKNSTICPRLAGIVDWLTAEQTRASLHGAGEAPEALAYVADRMPTFVYYSNYGNLDSEIYLPHVIANMARTDLGARESAKARTLKVLFDFVHLKPAEILDLGRDFVSHDGTQPTVAQIEAISRKKKEREILMTSASTELTNKFRNWWKQGTYRFRFDADGDHFRIWVSDDKRHEEIELESRSTGLQWFLSFYLIFLVESNDEHAGTILLLDEPGLSLHPLAQRDLSKFFESLSTTNQILYTTHSPFLVDPDHLDRVKAVFVQNDGTTGVSSDLRAGEKESQQVRSIYPVHAAVGLSVSDTLLAGAHLVIVEGPSDQLYLSAIKILLISAGRIKPPREIVFVPATGVNGIKAVASVLAGRDGEFPRVLVDGDAAGIKLARDMKNGWYSNEKGKILDVTAYTLVAEPEIEDLMPSNVISSLATRLLRDGSADDEFAEVYDEKANIVNQITQYASKYGVALAVGWKVDLARQVKTRLLKSGAKSIESTLLDRWTLLFEAIMGHASER